MRKPRGSSELLAMLYGRKACQWGTLDAFRYGGDTACVTSCVTWNSCIELLSRFRNFRDYSTAHSLSISSHSRGYSSWGRAVHLMQCACRKSQAKGMLQLGTLPAVSLSVSQNHLGPSARTSEITETISLCHHQDYVTGFYSRQKAYTFMIRVPNQRILGCSTYKYSSCFPLAQKPQTNF